MTRSIEELNGEVARKLRGNFLHETDHKIDFVALLALLALLPHSAISCESYSSLLLQRALCLRVFLRISPASDPPDPLPEVRMGASWLPIIFFTLVFGVVGLIIPFMIPKNPNRG